MNKRVNNIKSFELNKKIFFILFIFFLFFGISSIASADTLYWYSNSDTDWTNVSNWWTDSNHTIQASTIPTASDTAILITSTTPVIDIDNPSWVEAPSEIDATSTGVSIGCISCLNPFVGIITGNVVFTGSVFTQSIITGDVIFRDNSYSDWGNTITGNATFYDDSYNGSSECIIDGDATFYDDSSNRGTVTGDATFYNNSYNEFTVNNNVIFYDNAYSSSSGVVDGNVTFMYLTATNGMATSVDGYANGTVSGVTYDSVGAPITTWVFSTTDNIGTVTGNAIFNNHSYNKGSVSGSITFNYSPGSPMLKFGDVSRVVNINDPAIFSFTMFNKRGNVVCPSCTYTVSTNPSSSISALTKSGNQVSGSFTPTKLGTYSLIVTVTNPSDSSNAIWNDMFFVVDPEITITDQTTRYYLRSNTPINNSTKGNLGDIGSLMFSQPESEEIRQCSTFVTDVIDELPTNFPASSLLSKLDTHLTYKGNLYAKIGVQRFATYDSFFDKEEIVSPSDTYISTDLSFQDINFPINSPIYLYSFGLKLVSGFPFWKTSPSDISYADINYEYTTTPLVRTTTGTNTDVLLLSATEPVGDTNNATIVLNNTFPGSLSTNLLIGDSSSNPFRRPFEGYTTTINSDGTAILKAIGITGITTINSVPLDITPNAGEIDVSSITTASIDNGTTYYPNHWIESGNGVTSAIHTIGNLFPNTYYVVKVDGGNTFDDVYQSNSSGQLTFNYSSGYSVHTFDITEKTNNSTKSSGSYLPLRITSEIITGCEGMTTGYNILNGHSCGNEVPTLLISSPKYIFTKKLKYKMADTEVKYLQIVLNQNVDTQVSQIGGGSPGKETNYFGKATLSAVKKFQTKHGLNPDGIVGKLTIAKLIEIKN